MTQTLTGPLFASMLKSASASLSKNRQLVNDLNVFPVPDGDTGDNMSMTLSSAVSTLDFSGSLEKTASAASSSALLGARGNSGVILSRILKGLSDGFSGLIEATPADLLHALSCAVTEAYAAVAHPVEGTILSVLKDATLFATSAQTDSSTIDSILSDFSDELRRSTERTPDLLPALKAAGVVDSGAAGLIYIFDGFLAALRGEIVSDDAAPSDVSSQSELDISLFTEDSILEYGYCTEFLLRLQNSKCDLEDFDLDALISYLNSIGDSVVAFREGSIVKAHVHTKNPGKVLNHCQGFGEFLKLKIENMTLQHHAASIREDYVPSSLKPKKPYAIVTVASGDGIRDTFTALGADVVISGGQTMNPSTADFIKAYESLDADTILVYPNNKNILMSATQSAELYTSAKVLIIPTRTIGEGYVAISMLDTTSGDPDAIIQSQKDIISTVTTGIVSAASRTITMDDISIKKGDYIGYVGDKIHVDESSAEAALRTLASELSYDTHDIVILVHGASVSASAASSLAAELQSGAPLTEVISLDGGQPVHDYILILN